MSTQPLAGEDTAARFDPIGATYSSKHSFIDRVSTLSAEQGFRVWIGEGRSLRDVDGHKAGRVELACYRFRNKDEQGKRTRVGGCRFVIKAVQCYEKGVEVDERKWKLVAGTFAHNHDCGVALAIPKKSTPRAPRLKSARAVRAVKAGKAVKAPSTPSDDGEWHGSDEQGTPASSAYDSERVMGTNSSSLNPSESSRCQSVIDGPVLPTAPLHSMPTPMASPQHRVASQADEISHLPVDHATLLDSPLHHLLASEISTDPYAFLDMSFPTRSIEDVLSEDGTDLEQYADGFILGGCCDTGALLGMTDEAIQHLLLVDLPILHPSLLTNEYHTSRLSALLASHRLNAGPGYPPAFNSLSHSHSPYDALTDLLTPQSHDSHSSIHDALPTEDEILLQNILQQARIEQEARDVEVVVLTVPSHAPVEGSSRKRPHEELEDEEEKPFIRSGRSLHS